jgi:hypothetical protein
MLVGYIWDGFYFWEVCGLYQGEGVNLYNLKEKRDIPATIIFAEFGKPTRRFGFKIGYCSELKMDMEVD